MKSKRFLILLVVGAMGLVTSCSTVTIRDRGVGKISSEPTYSKSHAIFLWGIAGTGHVNVKEICGSKKAIQLQSEHSFFDGVLNIFTLGIYAPRSSYVWCDDEGGQS